MSLAAPDIDNAMLTPLRSERGSDGYGPEFGRKEWDAERARLIRADFYTVEQVENVAGSLASIDRALKAGAAVIGVVGTPTEGETAFDKALAMYRRDVSAVWAANAVMAEALRQLRGDAVNANTIIEGSEQAVIDEHGERPD